MTGEKKLKILLNNTGKKERCKYQISLILTMIATLLFSMFAFGLSDITNETLSQRDVEQLQGVLSSVILVSIISIALLSWIISVLLKAFLQIREQFTESVLLMGIPRKKIACIYIKELFRLYFQAMLIGCFIGGIVYFVVANLFSIDEKIVPINIYVITILISTILNICIISHSVYAVLKGNVIENIRNRNKYCKTKNVKWIYVLIRIIISIGIILCSNYLVKNISIRQLSELSKILNIVAIMILFDPIVRCIYEIIYVVSKKIRINYIILSVKISKSYFDRVKLTCYFIILSYTIFIGLHSMFNIARDAGVDIVNNIKYLYVESNENTSTSQNDSDNLIYYGVKMKAKTESGTNIFVSGIDELYSEYYEDIHLTKESEKGLNEITNSYSNGILMPEAFASSNDIGKEIKININGHYYKFKVVGLYYLNNFSELNCFVNSEYLKDQLKLKTNDYNVIYMNQKVDIDDNNKILTKSEIALKSKEKAVSGTSIVETISYLLIVCAIICLLIYYSLIAQNSKNDIYRFKCMGMSDKKLVKIYLLNSIFPVLISGIFMVPIARMFTRLGLYTMLSPYYFTNVYKSYVPIELCTILVFLIISMFVQITYVFKFTNKDDHIQVLRGSL